MLVNRIFILYFSRNLSDRIVIFLRGFYFCIFQHNFDRFKTWHFGCFTFFTLLHFSSFHSIIMISSRFSYNYSVKIDMLFFVLPYSRRQWLSEPKMNATAIVKVKSDTKSKICRSTVRVKFCEKKKNVEPESVINSKRWNGFEMTAINGIFI